MYASASTASFGSKGSPDYPNIGLRWMAVNVCTGTSTAGAKGPGASPAPSSGQPALQETVGQVVLPFFMMVTPKLLPLPLGLAVIT